MTYSADVLIPANSSTRTEGLRAFNDNGSGRFLATATLPYTFFWNEHTLCVGLLIQCIHWELYKRVCHHSSVVLQKKNHHNDILCTKLWNVKEVIIWLLIFHLPHNFIYLDEVLYTRNRLNFSVVFQFITAHQNTCHTQFIMDDQNYLKHSVCPIFTFTDKFNKHLFNQNTVLAQIPRE